MILLGIDPGSADPGNACATMLDGALEDCWFERVQTFTGLSAEPVTFLTPRARYASASAVDIILVERPAFQGDRSFNARPEDLMNLAWSGALLAGTFAGRDGAPIVEVSPGEWKGSEPKPQQHARLWEILTGRERKILGGDRVGEAIYKAREKGALNRWGKPGAAYYPRAFKTHNLLDAVALCAVYLGRLERP